MSDVVFDRMLFDHLDKVTDQTNRIAALEDEIARLRLTAEERGAVHWFAHYGLPEHHAAALRGLLERLGGGR